MRLTKREAFHLLLFSPTFFLKMQKKKNIMALLWLLSPPQTIGNTLVQCTVPPAATEAAERSRWSTASLISGKLSDAWRCPAVFGAV